MAGDSKTCGSQAWSSCTCGHCQSVDKTAPVNPVRPLPEEEVTERGKKNKNKYSYFLKNTSFRVQRKLAAFPKSFQLRNGQRGLVEIWPVCMSAAASGNFSEVWLEAAVLLFLLDYVWSRRALVLTAASSCLDWRQVWASNFRIVYVLCA